MVLVAKVRCRQQERENGEIVNHYEQSHDYVDLVVVEKPPHDYIAKPAENDATCAHAVGTWGAEKPGHHSACHDDDSSNADKLGYAPIGHQETED